MKLLQFWKSIQEYVLIALGLLLYALAWKGILLQHQIVGGGVTGIAALVQFATHGYVPVWLTNGAINGVLLVIAVIVLGWRFCLRTIFGVACVTFWLAFIPQLEQPLVPLDDKFMATIVAGAMMGAGIAVVFMNNGSTGGTDIVAMVVNKYRQVSLGRTLFYCDLVIISSSYFLPDGDFYSVIYGLVVMTVMTFTIDTVMNGVKQSVQFFIFSQKYEEIADAINRDVPRGVTILNGEGWYSKQPMHVITVLAKKNEARKIFSIVDRIDPNAFVSMSSANGVYGKGFEQIR